ncbi:IQ and AAA domain-containing protein 1-like [Panulirus ornatus]|uniref:IQ and AAA domain-containing protein 1-like n=1 Tax=Panulirus ornatus TaxID=150431 RepID=UPI003A89735E
MDEKWSSVFPSSISISAIDLIPISVSLMTGNINYFMASRVAMTTMTFTALWAETQGELCAILEKDYELQGTFNQDQRGEVIHLLKGVYVRYLGVARHLNTCHDLLLHPQKRLLLRRLLDATVGRIVELKVRAAVSKVRAAVSKVRAAVSKHELVSLELSDVQHCDDIMSELNLTPQDLVVPIPTYVRRERLPIINEVSYYGLLIYTLMERERGRGRQQLSVEEAVVRLQAVTRGMLARRHVRHMRRHEELFLALCPDPEVDRGWKGKLRKVEEWRYLVQVERRQELEDLQKHTQTKIVYEEGPHLMTTMEDKIREWIFHKKHETGKFPDLPEEDEGGSSAIVGLAQPDDDVTSEEARALEKKSERERSRELAKQKKKKEEEERSITLKPSTFLADIQAACDQYQDVWSLRPVEENPEERPEGDMIEVEERARVEREMRRQVDYLMRQELQRLKEDVEGEKRGAKKKKRVKKGGKKVRKRKEKDLTPDRTTESLFEELVLNGIIRKLPEVRLADVLGDVNLVGSQLVARTSYPQPTMGDVKNLLTEYVVLPIGVDGVRERTPLVKSVLVAGPRGCGKTRLVEALAQEAGATLMDLTATNIVGRYPGRAGLNMLTHLVMKVGRLLQPTVVLIDVADKMFMKKVPKTDKSDPRRLKKELPRMLKSLGPEDRMVFIGITNSPWTCDVKSLSSVYQKIVMIHRPTYSVRAELWRHLIVQHGAQLTPRLDISGLARISDGYTSGHICSVVSQVVTEQRLAKQEKTPLTAAEFVVPLSKIEPIYREEEEAMELWYQRTPMMRKRTRLLEEEQQAHGLKGKKGEAKSSKKGKKKKKKK